MQQTRRTFLSTSAAAGLAALAAPRIVQAALSIGDAQIDVVSDGSLRLPGSFLYGPMPQDELLPLLQFHDQPLETVIRPCNVTLLRHGDRVVLFDVGSGYDFAPTAGELVDSLDMLGVAPEDVTDVVFTHGHPDHLWGLLDDFDDLLFADARFLIGKTEWDYWIDPNTVDRIGESRASFAAGAKRRLERIEDAVNFFGDGEEILPGVAARATFGHTPGHMAFEVRSGTEAVMIIGDAIGDEHVAFARPDWHSGADQDQAAGAAARQSLLDQLAQEQMRLIGFHFAGNGIGRVERADGAYRFVAEG